MGHDGCIVTEPIELAEEFGGTDAAKPPLWVTRNQTKAKLWELHAGYSNFIQPLALPDLEEEDLEKVREVVRQAAER